MVKKAKNLGIGVKAPKEKCTDPNCPFHGRLSVRGRIFKGNIIKLDMNRTAVVEWERPYYIQKYERYEKRRTRVKAHNPACIDAAVGDKVTIAECRQISKAKSFVIVEK